ncbi:MAG: hypothetical protein R6W96_02785 [Clostridia bacterium]
MDEGKKANLKKRVFSIVLLVLFVLLILNVTIFQFYLEYSLAAYAFVILYYLFAYRKSGSGGDDDKTGE